MGSGQEAEKVEKIENLARSQDAYKEVLMRNENEESISILISYRIESII